MSQDTSQSPSSFAWKKVEIETHDGKTYNMTPIVFGFMYYEDISKPFITANLFITDSGMNARSEAPIQGYEKVTIEVSAPGEDGTDQDYEYEFYVYRLGDIVISNKVQTYNMGLISKEALQNEGVRISKTLKGYPHDIAKECIEDFLKSDKDFFADEATNKSVFIAANKTPFTVCANLLYKSMSAPTPRTDSGGDNSTLTGHSGFMFFENAKGFNFRSINNLCDPTKDLPGGDGKGRTFTDSATPDGSLSNVITNVQFDSEINVMEGLRLGAYCSELQTYNFDTGYVETGFFSAKDEYDNQSHLGANEKLTEGQIKLSKTPTRITSSIISNEAYYSGQDNASVDAEIKDWTKNTLVQSISRNYLLNTQGLKIEVPGNLDLVVGEKVNVILPSSVTQDERATAPTDTENSGVYLITQLSRFYDRPTMNVKTVLKLHRDSYGYEEPGTST